MVEETKPSETETLKVIEEELKALPITKEEELKNASMVEGQKSQKATSAIEGLESMKKIQLVTSDNVMFKVDLSIVKEMETITSSLDSSGSDNSALIPLPNVTSHYLRLIIDYSVNHYRLSEVDNLRELKEFEKRFVEEMTTDELKELLLAANYLDMKNFFEIMCHNMTNNIKNKSVEFVRDLFGLTNDYTPDEETEYRQAKAWAFHNID